MANKWARTVEPRLSGNGPWEPCAAFLRKGRIVPEARCEDAQMDETRRCHEPSNAQEAARMVALEPHCTSEAIEVLRRNADKRQAVSDLAAAYYVRAQREDRPEDFLEALKNAQDANAWFNVALAQEAIGLDDAAASSWARVEDDSRWGDEARRRLTELRRIPDPTLQWQSAQQPLLAALRQRDRARVARLIAHSPRSAEEFAEDVLLPEHVPEAKVLAEVWRERTGDAYLTDLVRAFETTADPDALRKGHREFSAGRRAERAFDIKGAVAHYDAASALLSRAGSPLRFLCDIRREIRNGPKAAEPPYEYLRAQLGSWRAYSQQFAGRLPESIATYSRVIGYYERIGDHENAAIHYGRRSSVYVHAGDYANAWRDAYRASRFVHAIVDVQERHTLLGELSDAAKSLGYAQPALAYENAAINVLRAALLRIPPERLDLIARMQANLSVAYRKRAELELRVGRPAAAMRDLDNATAFTKGTRDATVKRLLEARDMEIAGQARLGLDNPEGAVETFTRALELSAVDTFPTYRASLFAQRADAHRRAHHRDAAEHDLAECIRILREEQTMNLELRARQENEIWIPYFSRFRDALDRLVRLLIEDRRYAEAFDYVEQARAAEPLDLVMRLGTSPEMVALKNARGPARVLAIQKKLPHGTFVLQYAVLEDRTYTWVLTRDLGVIVTQPATRERVERWAAEVRSAVRANSDFSLEAPYAQLMAGTLGAIRRMPGGDHPRIVIVPDGAMHGLPFAALKNGDTGRFLVSEVEAVEIAPSALFYVNALMGDRELPRSGKDLFLIGNPAFNTRLPVAQGLPVLAAAEEEGRRIHDIYGDRAVLRTKSDATVPAFLELARDRAIVHVAGHTVVDARNPSQSVILLAPSDDHSGALTAQEILDRVRLRRTRLIVLSTCSSAGGRPVGPEGMAPLVRPFLSAGVPAVIGTLWDVDDATAKDLMVSFHVYYARGDDAATALRNAQRDLLRSTEPDRKRALAWSSFEVIGHASSPFAAAHDTEKQKEKPP